MSAVKDNLLAVSYEQGMWHKFVYRQTQNIHKRLVKGSGNYYLKPNDIISHRPTLFAYHEPHLEALFAKAAETHSDFLLDIGANIGMTSVMVGDAFNEIHCVEPNRLLTKILDVNLALASLSEKAQIHPIGLGTDNKKDTLIIPRKNFGGAYIETGNAYNAEAGVGDRQAADNLSQEIEIISADEWVKQIFNDNKSWQNGVIKIDVEGFEMVVLQAVLAHLPAHVSVIVIMENFLSQIDFDSFTAPSHTLDWYGFYKEKQFLKSLFFKLFGMSSYNKLQLAPLDKSQNAPHDLVLHLSPH